MSDMGDLITAGTGLLVALGGGIAWLRREIKSDRAAAETRFQSIERALEECRDRETRANERRQRSLTVIEILWQEVQRIAPKSRVLDRAKHLLAELKTIDGEH